MHGHQALTGDSTTATEDVCHREPYPSFSESVRFQWLSAPLFCRIKRTPAVMRTSDCARPPKSSTIFAR